MSTKWPPELWARYVEYLNSDAWKLKRGDAMERDGGWCRLCGARGTVVHHLTYKRLFDEDLADLLTVCAPCHYKIHEWSWYPVRWFDETDIAFFIAIVQHFVPDNSVDGALQAPTDLRTFFVEQSVKVRKRKNVVLSIDLPNEINDTKVRK